MALYCEFIAADGSAPARSWDATCGHLPAGIRVRVDGDDADGCAISLQDSAGGEALWVDRGWGFSVSGGQTATARLPRDLAERVRLVFRVGGEAPGRLVYVLRDAHGPRSDA